MAIQTSERVGLRRPSVQPLAPVAEQTTIVRSGLRARLRAAAECRRLNRAFRRRQREFFSAVDAVSHDPAAQRELSGIWASRD
jgi:hypothetical protein